MIANDKEQVETDSQAEEAEHGLLRLAGGLVSALGLGGYLFWALNGGLVREGNWIGVDFHVYYAAAQVLMRGDDVYTAGISPPYVYPPLLGYLVIPIALLSVTAATIIWKLLQHVCLLIAGALLVNLLPSRLRPLATGVLFLGLLTVPLQDEIQVGESNSLILALIVGALWLVARMDRAPQIESAVPERFSASRLMSTYIAPITPASLSAGVLLALAASIKVLPVLLIAYFWWRGPRNVAAIATAGSLIIQALLFVLTPSTADYWFTQFPGLFGQAFPFLDNQSLNALISRATLPSTDPATPNMQVIAAESWRPSLTWLANLVTLAATIAVLWASQRRPLPYSKQAHTIRLLLEVGLVLLTIHLVSGSTWLHHLIDLAVPILALIGSWWLAYQNNENQSSNGRALLYGGALGLLLAAFLNRPYDWLIMVNIMVPGNVLLALIASSVGTWMIIALWAWTAMRLLRTQRNL